LLRVGILMFTSIFSIVHTIVIFVNVSFYNPNTSFTSDIFEAARFKLAWRLSLAFFLVFAILATMFSFIEIQGFIIYSIVSLLSITALFYLNYTKKSSFIFWLFTVSASILVYFSMYTIHDTLHYSDIVWIMCIILFAFIGLSYKMAFVFVGIHIIGLAIFIFTELNNHIEVLAPRSNFELMNVVIEIVFALIIMSYLLQENVRYYRNIWDELQEVNSKLASKNKENITLLKEVHHRVKNNLQIVVSLLRIQNTDIQSLETKEHFKTAINRIMTISMIHRKLYQSGELSEIEFKKYIHSLIEDIKNLHIDDDEITINVASNLSEIDLNSIVPLGLIINELITNSIKHAFNKGDKRTISIRFDVDKNEKVVLDYSDSGEWRESETTGFGIELLELLTEQLDGNLTRESSFFRIEFPQKQKA
jgi:two-component sensor histidine kinase